MTVRVILSSGGGDGLDETRIRRVSAWGGDEVIGRLGIRGPRAIPPGGWPLDDLFVGVVTLRTMREMFARDRVHPGRDWRPSRLSLRVAGSLPGCTKATRRLERAGLLEGLPPTEHGRARSYRLDHSHPLVDELAGLFSSEWGVVEGRRS